MYRWGQETVDIAITADGEGCLVTLRHDGIVTDELGGVLTGGWTISLSQLEHTLYSRSIKEEI